MMDVFSKSKFQVIYCLHLWRSLVLMDFRHIGLLVGPTKFIIRLYNCNSHTNSHHNLNSDLSGFSISALLDTLHYWRVGHLDI